MSMNFDYITARISKVWGNELYIVNSHLYCAKILDISSGGCSSLHYHKIKDETFHVLEGCCFLFWDGHTLTLTQGDCVQIKPGVHHKFYCDPNNASMQNGCKILEVSTHHDDNDVVRIEESRRL